MIYLKLVLYISKLQIFYLVIDVPISLSIQANSDLQRFLAQRKSQGVEVGGGLDCVRPSRWRPETYTYFSCTYNESNKLQGAGARCAAAGQPEDVRQRGEGGVRGRGRGHQQEVPGGVPQRHPPGQPRLSTDNITAN